MIADTLKNKQITDQSTNRENNNYNYRQWKESLVTALTFKDTFHSNRISYVTLHVFCCIIYNNAKFKLIGLCKHTPLPPVLCVMVAFETY